MSTFTQLHIHAVISVKNRAKLIQKEIKSRVYHYMTAILQNHGHKMLAINGMPDHVHLLFGLRPNQSLSELMRILKGDSSEWINKQKLTRCKFRWQEGYSAFAVSKSNVDSVCKYIFNQETPHKKVTFREELLGFLKKAEIPFNEKYIFPEPPEHP